MKWFKRIVTLLLVLLVAGFLHYFLPSRDIVQVVGTDVKRMDIEGRAWFWDRPDAGTNNNATRDVRFINATWPNGKSRVYRNEDTDWSFPPYFKFDSGDLNAQAQSLARTSDEQWVIVSHYGWRIELFSIFPNAYKIKKTTGPDALLVPWFNIAFLTILALIIVWIYSKVRGLKRKHVDPVTDQIGDNIDKAADNVRDEVTKGGNAIGRVWRKLFGTRNPPP